MSVLQILEQLPRVAAEESEDERTTARTFKVQVSDRTDGPLTVLKDAMVPKLGSKHPEDDKLLCRTRSCEPDTASPYWLDLTVVYSTKTDFYGQDVTQPPSGSPDDPSGTPEIDNPLLRPIEYTFDGRDIESPMEVAELLNDQVTGPAQPIVNTAGDPIKGVTRIETKTTFTASRYEAINAQTLVANINKYRNKVNSADSDYFNSNLGVVPHEVRMAKISARSTYESGNFYWHVTYHMEFLRGAPSLEPNPDYDPEQPTGPGNEAYLDVFPGWQSKLRSVGRRARRQPGPAFPAKDIIDDDTGVVSNEDRDLDANGMLANVEYVPVGGGTAQTGDVAYIDVIKYREENFDDLYLLGAEPLP